MTEYVWAALLLVGAVAVAALGLALVVTRRLRVLQDQMTQFALPIGPDLPEPGMPVPDFAATTSAGVTVGTADLAGPEALVLFLDGTCSSCFDAVARLREMRDDAGSADSRPIAVVVGVPEERAALVAQLEPLAHVIEESYDMALAGRFGVRGFPAILVFSDGVVRAASHRLDHIELGAPV